MTNDSSVVNVNKMIEKIRRKMNVMGESDLKDIFLQIDADRNGELDFDEFRLAMRRFEILMSEGEMKQMFDYFDSQSRQAISYNNFITVLQKEHLDMLKIGQKIRTYLDTNDMNLINYFLKANENKSYFELADLRVPVRVSGQFETVEQVRALPIRAGQRTLSLGDIATAIRLPGYDKH